jgi:hypothetical protein
MKKLLPILALVILLASCKKQSVGNTGCFKCTYGTVNGYTKPDDVYCGSLSNYHPTYQGAEISYSCQK